MRAQTFSFAAMLVVLTALNGFAQETTPQQAKSAPDVWWGNRSISFGNYMRFERIVFAKVEEAPIPVHFKKIFFDLDKSELRPESIDECRRVVEYLEAHPKKRVTIEGHTCDLASEAYNLALGQRRADAVKKYLIDHGIDADRIDTQTFGESQPWVGVSVRELNRRAVVIVLDDNGR